MAQQTQTSLFGRIETQKQDVAIWSPSRPGPCASPSGPPPADQCTGECMLAAAGPPSRPVPAVLGFALQ